MSSADVAGSCPGSSTARATSSIRLSKTSEDPPGRCGRGASRRAAAPHVEILGCAEGSPGELQVNGAANVQGPEKEVEELQRLIGRLSIEGAHVKGGVVRQVLKLVLLRLGVEADLGPFSVTGVLHAKRAACAGGAVNREDAA